jgi:nitrogen fixation protein FixH
MRLKLISSVLTFKNISMKLNWGTSMAIVYITFAVIMILLVIRTSNIKNELVTENYYNEAVKFQDRIDENANASNVNSKICVAYSNLHHSIELNMEGDVKSIAGKLSFYKPDKAADDFEIGFHTNETGYQSIPLKSMAHGYWRVSATYSVNGKNCIAEEKIFVE